MSTSYDSQKISAMREGGRVLAQIRDQLPAMTRPGMSFAEIEAKVTALVKEAGMKPSFSTVPGYHWTTCVMRNNELCHGIPAKDKHVKPSDLVTIDLGLINQGYHLDTTISFQVKPFTPEVQEFLNIGKKSLRKAINKVKAGASVYQVSQAMERVLVRHGLGVVYQLTGHGVGEELHMDPVIPCLAVPETKRDILKSGQTIAVEVMYTSGEPHLEVDTDGWTYKTVDGSLSAMFEETVLVTDKGFEILTKAVKVSAN